MTMIQFVQNYDDLSTDMGFQFKFHCDKCHNGFMSRFQPSAMGMAGSALRVAENLFGGVFGRGASSAYEVQRAVGGKAHDEALETAVKEGKEHFHQCGRCGIWVCPEVCWNAQAGQCTGCAPKFEQEFASAHAHAKANAANQQLNEKAQQTDYVSGVDMRANAVFQAPGQQAPMAQAPAPQQALPAGAPPQLAAGGDACTSCNTPLGQFKFCPNCGAPRAPKPAVCTGCQQPLVPGMKFCGNCGARLG